MLAAPVLLGSGLLTATALAVAVRRLDYERIPQAAVLAAAFFVASLVSVPVGPGSVHLILNGLIGLILGWAAVPAILVALVMQVTFFGHGGLLVLGANTFNIAAPALVCTALVGPFIGRVRGGAPLFALGALAGALGVALTGALVALSLGLSDPAFLPAAKVILATYIPLLLAEAAVTGGAAVFLRRVAPELLLRRGGSLA